MDALLQQQQQRGAAAVDDEAGRAGPVIEPVTEPVVEPAEVIVIEDDEVPPLIVIDDDDATSAEAPVEATAEAPLETPTECVICQEGGNLIESNYHECHVQVHRTCLDNWSFPRLNEPTCPHCRDHDDPQQ